MAAGQHRMEMPFVIWHALVMQPRLVVVRIGWICTPTAADRHLQLPPRLRLQLQQRPLLAGTSEDVTLTMSGAVLSAMVKQFLVELLQ